MSKPNYPRDYAKEHQSVEVGDVEKFIPLLSNDVSDHIMEHHEYQYCIKGEHDVDADLKYRVYFLLSLWRC